MRLHALPALSLVQIVALSTGGAVGGIVALSALGRAGETEVGASHLCEVVSRLAGGAGVITQALEAVLGAGGTVGSEIDKVAIHACLAGYPCLTGSAMERALEAEVDHSREVVATLTTAPSAPLATISPREGYRYPTSLQWVSQSSARPAPPISTIVRAASLPLGAPPASLATT